MPFPINDIAGMRDEKEFVAVEQILFMMAFNTQAYDNLCAKAFGSDNSILGKADDAKIGRFGDYGFSHIVNTHLGLTGTNLAAMNAIVDNLEKSGLGIRPNMPGFSAKLIIAPENVRQFAKEGSLAYAIHNSIYFTQRESQRSIMLIEVEKDGVPYHGTGFIARVPLETDRYFLVTAKHVVNPSDKIIVKKISGLSFNLPHECNWRLSPDTDLACVEFDQNPGVSISLGSYVHPLMQVVTLGFPAIPSSKANPLLSHSGEVNGIFNSFWDKTNYISITNDVAPGSSGGPVVSKLGTLVGVVVSAFDQFDQVASKQVKGRGRARVRRMYRGRSVRACIHVTDLNHFLVGDTPNTP